MICIYQKRKQKSENNNQQIIISDFLQKEWN